MARSGFAANTRAEAFYPRTDRDSVGRLLDGRHRYTITFRPGALPPVRAFWSLTMYDTHLFLVPNQVNRYSIGDRTPGLSFGKGHSLTIYVQHSQPLAAQRANWLPAPAGRFRLSLRLYEPKPQTYTHWTPPVVTRIDRAHAKTDAASRGCLWVGPYTTKRGPRFNQAFPDSAAVYWTARYTTPPGATLRLKGRFAHARYESLSSYGAGTGGPVDSLNDVSTRPDRGSINPFKAGADRTARDRDYTITVAAAPRPPNPNLKNNMLYAGVRGRTDQELIYRFYLADRGEDLTGGTGLPVPELTLADGTALRGRSACAALHASGQELEPSSLPRSLYESLRNQPGKPLTFPAEKPLHWGAFYSTSYTIACVYENACDPHPKRVGGQYSNVDNSYVGAFLNRRFGRVLVLRGTLPVTPATHDGERRMGAGQMRYWSMCQNESFATTAGAGCIYDEHVPIDKHRHYVIVTSRAADRPSNATSRCGVGFVPWPVHGDGAGHPDDALLLIRNMLPSSGFRHAVQDTKTPGDERKVMSRYLPHGTYMSPRQFERRGCPNA